MRNWHAVMAVVALLGVGCGGGAPTSEVGSSTPGLEAPTPTAAPAASATAAVAVPRRHIVPNGGTLPSENGLLYVNLETAEMEFWALPGRYFARPLSRDDRWVVWGAQGEAGTHLLDLRTGLDRLLTVRGEPAGAAGFSVDGQLLLAETSSRVALLETASVRVLAEVPHPLGISNGAAEFAPDGSVAKGFGGVADASRTTLVFRPDGATLVIDGGTWPIRWSPDGSLLAVTTPTGMRVVSVLGDAKRDIPFVGVGRGYNPRWSPDGRYLAVANPYDVGGQRVFDASSGKEILRAVGTITCIGDYWFEDGTLEYGWEGQRVAVPSGEIRQGAPRWPQDVGFRFDDSALPPTTRLLLANGKSVEFRSNGNWSYYYDGDGLRGVTITGRALFLVGVGGRGLCDGALPEAAVYLPPFAD